MVNDPNLTFIFGWLVEFGGGEQILSAMLDIWPQAPIHTLVHDPEGQCRQLTQGREVKTSFIQNLPWAKQKYRSYLPLMPLAVEQHDVRSYDVVISLSHSFSHGIIPQPDQLHINYIFIPMRFVWHLYHQYLHQAGLISGVKSWAIKPILHYMRLWDVAAANRVDHFVAISRWVSRNVWRAYRRTSTVIYPPVEIESFSPVEKKEDFYLTISRMVPYKKVDLIVEAFTQMPSKKLIVIGDGPEFDKIQSKAGKNIEFLGYQPFDGPVLKECLHKARAFIFAAVEDFGIAPVEAQACGTPVIAYGKGGVLETVVEGKTGLFYLKQTPQSLVEAIQRFEQENIQFSIRDLRNNAERFSKNRFQNEFKAFVDQSWASFQNNG